MKVQIFAKSSFLLRKIKKRFKVFYIIKLEQVNIYLQNGEPLKQKNKWLPFQKKTAIIKGLDINYFKDKGEYLHLPDLNEFLQGLSKL